MWPTKFSSLPVKCADYEVWHMAELQHSMKETALFFLWRDHQPVSGRKAPVNSCHSGRLTSRLILSDSVFNVIINVVSSDICVSIFCQIQPQIFSVKISFERHYFSRLGGAGSHRDVGGFDFCWINLDVKCWSSHTIATVAAGRNVGVGCFRGSSCSLLFFKPTDAGWLLMALSHANIQPKPPNTGWFLTWCMQNVCVKANPASFYHGRSFAFFDNLTLTLDIFIRGV